MTAVKNMGMWDRGVERGLEALDNAWRHADLRQPNVRRQREASRFVQCLRLRSWFVLSFCCCSYVLTCRPIPMQPHANVVTASGGDCGDSSWDHDEGGSRGVT